MDRRTFMYGLGVGLLTAPLAAEAQPAGKVYRIGILETTALASNAANIDAFRRGLRELGYVEGQNFVIEYQSADGRAERFPDLATELVRRKVDLILTRGTPAVLAAKKATATIPIVMASSGDPVGAGVVSSLARPGGNVTGLSTMAPLLAGKRLALLKDGFPAVERIAYVADMSNPAFVSAAKQDIEITARSLGFLVRFFDVRKAEDIGPAFEAAIKQRVDAVAVALDPVTQANFRRSVELSVKHRLPSIFASREFAEAGGLMSYGAKLPDLYRRAAAYVDKTLKGAKPSDLPIEQPEKFELVINLKTAKALGLTIPPSLLLRADQIIE
jgi:putative tryptophan/tyrosine transport system substrate-binding protein